MEGTIYKSEVLLLIIKLSGYSVLLEFLFYKNKKKKELLSPSVPPTLTQALSQK